MDSGPLLTATGIHKRFGGVRALRGADADFRRGEVHFLLGENGAGKSTLGKIIAGVHGSDAGALALDGKPFAPRNPTEAQRHGVAIIFQELDLFPNLTVAENIAIRNFCYREPPFVSRRRLADFARPHLERVRLKIPLGTRVSNLSIGQMQLVAIARALSMKARLIVMDEPTSALTRDAVETLFEIVEDLRAEGVSMIYVSHKMEELKAIADRVTVMRDGETIETVNAADATVDELIAMMVGRPMEAVAARVEREPGEVRLAVDNLTTRAIRDVSFDVRRGEVLGIAGLVGAGRSEIGLALMGIDRITAGTVQIEGIPYRPAHPRAAIRAGVGLAPEDRKIAGLMMQMSVRENMSLSSLPRLKAAGFVNHGAENRAYGGVAKETMLKTASPRVAVSTLSGGNQQKVLLGRWLLVDPEIFFLDDPTRGVDVGAKEDIYAIIERLAERGKAVMMVSSELPELLRCCDRILVMRQGAAAGILDARTATQEEIMKLAAVEEPVPAGAAG